MNANRMSVCLFLLVIVLLAASLSFSQETPAKEEKAAKGPPAAIVEELEFYFRVEGDGRVEETDRGRVHILTEKARQAWGQVFVPFRAEIGDAHVEHVRTVKPDGETVEASVDQIMEVTPPVAQQAPTFTDLRYKVIPVPGLQVGDRLEFAVVISLRQPVKPGDFWLSHYPNRQMKVISERVTLDLPAERAVSLKFDDSLEHSVEEADGRRRYIWTLSNPEPQEGSALQRPLFTVSSVGSWTEVGAWFRDLQAGRADVTPELQALVQQIVGGQDEPRAKLEALYRYVSQSVRYVSISLGLGGFQAHRAAEVRQNQYGDCKDKHVLLQALLSAVGLRAYPALVNSQLDIETTVPSPGQFDHVISVVPLGEDWIWMDTTMEVAPIGVLLPALRGKQALLVLDDESRLVEIPKQPPVPDRRWASFTGNINAKGALAATVRYENQGIFEVLWRQLFRQGSPDEIGALLRFDRPYTLWDADSDPPTSSDPLDVTAPFTFEYRLTKEGFINPLKRTIGIPVPGLLMQVLPWTLPDTETKGKEKEPEDAEAEQQEAKGIQLGGPLELEVEVEMTLPPNFELYPPRSVRQELDFASYQSDYTAGDHTLKVRRRLHIRQKELPLARRSELESFDKAVREDRDRTVNLTRVGGVDAPALADDLTADQLNEAGQDALEKGEFVTARDLFEKATEKDPNHEWAWNNLGRAELTLGQVDKAHAAFEKQIEINPADEYAHNNLGRVYLRRGQYDQAVEAFQKQIEINPSDRYAHANLAHTYGQLEQWSQAEAEYDKAIGISAEGPQLYIQRGEAQLRQGKNEEAQSSFERALEQSGAPYVYNNIAYVLAESAQQLDVALQYAESAVLRVEAELRLVNSLRNWKRSVGLQVSLGAYLDTLGWVLFQQGRTEEAAPYLQAAFDLSPSSEVAQHLARLRAHQGQFADGLRYYAQAVHLSKDLPVTVPSELESYVEENIGGPEGLSAAIERLQKEWGNSQQLQPDETALAWPGDATTSADEVVALICLTNENGEVIQAEAMQGEEPWQAVALTDAKKLRFPVASWNNRPLKTLRPITFRYKSDGTVVAQRADIRRSLTPALFPQSSEP